MRQNRTTPPLQSIPLRQALTALLTPASWRQAQQAWGSKPQPRRWQLQPLLWVLLLLCWCHGDSQEERFLTARAFYVACHPRDRRPGKTLPGFEKALARVPTRVLRALAAGLRLTLGQRLLPALKVGDFVPVGCDGSRLECPRARELEQRLGQAGKPDSAPTLWVTALVLLPAGLWWAWQLGPGTASEQAHALALLSWLPPHALFVADAGYLSYELFAALEKADVPFLIRMSSRAYLYTEQEVELARFREGPVSYWPRWAQQAGLPPVQARLLRLRGQKADVWLLTNVRDRRRLSRKQAQQFYRWRWGNEINQADYPSSNPLYSLCPGGYSRGRGPIGIGTLVPGVPCPASRRFLVSEHPADRVPPRARSPHARAG